MSEVQGIPIQRIIVEQPNIQRPIAEQQFIQRPIAEQQFIQRPIAEQQNQEQIQIQIQPDPSFPTSCCCRESEDRRFEIVLRNANISDLRKNAIRRRFMHVIKDFRTRAALYSALFHIGHFVITVGSLIVPALLSVQYINTDDPQFQSRVYWATWILSLLVTTFNGILVLFKVDKKYYFLHTTLERLRSEGWQYLELTGRYSGLLNNTTEPATYENQYRFFTHYVEKIKLKQVEEEYYKYEEANNPVSHPPQQKPSAYLPSINKDIDELKAPQSVKDAINSLIIPPSPFSEPMFQERIDIQSSEQQRMPPKVVSIQEAMNRSV